MIDYEDLKSDWLELEPNTKYEFEVVADAFKEIRLSKKSERSYPLYILKVKVKETTDSLKLGVFRSQYKDMVNQAGKPSTLVGTKWRITREVVDGKDETTIIKINDFSQA